ncbi:MAG: glycyl radical protein [Armatimonadota bacterium]
MTAALTRERERSAATDALREAQLSPRVAKLRELALSFADDKAPWERGRLVTESYMQTEALPMVLRRAKALAHVLANEEVEIYEGELIVGRAKRQLPVHKGMYDELDWMRGLREPDLNGGWIGDDPRIPDDIRELYAYWRERFVPLGRKVAALASDQERGAQRAGVYQSGGALGTHRSGDYAKAVREGMDAIKAQAEAKLKGLDETKAEDARRKPFWEAIVIVCQAVVRYAERYAEEARRLAAMEADARRKEELVEIARICERVPRLPARTFREALQSVWFVHIADETETCGSAQCFGRFDQYMHPYYQSDLAAGRLTRDQALELIECLWLKCYKTFDFQYAMVGGVKPDGTDGTNDLSYLCLDAMARLGLPRDLGVRIHKDTPPQFIEHVAEVVRLGLGRPDLWNDEVVIEGFRRKGIELEDARDYSAIGCVELTIPGRCNYRTMGHQINLSKCLELALNNGRCQMTGEQIGPEVGEQLHTYEAVHAAYRGQAAHFIRLAVQGNIRTQMLQPDELPHPFLSAITDDCVEVGRDVTDGGARYNPAGVNLFGVANVANSLAAIRQLVFEEELVTLDELREALANDFAGQESLRQMLRNRAPKYGNDDDGADQIAAEEVAFYCSELGKYRTVEGGRFHPLVFATSSSSVYGLGPATGAGADGRRSGAPLAINVMPDHGTDMRGATAALRSAAKIDYADTIGGVSYILDLHPSAVAGDEGVKKLASLIRGYFDEGGMELSVNIVGEDTLREAQECPERFRGLMVRVFGFSTQFVALDEATQQYVIERTKHRH